MHDGIQNFRMELNGVFICTLSTKFVETNILWMLKEVPGGSLCAEKLMNHLFNTIKSTMHVLATVL